MTISELATTVVWLESEQRLTREQTNRIVALCGDPSLREEIEKSREGKSPREEFLKMRETQPGSGMPWSWRFFRKAASG